MTFLLGQHYSLILSRHCEGWPAGSNRAEIYCMRLAMRPVRPKYREFYRFGGMGKNSQPETSALGYLLPTEFEHNLLAQNNKEVAVWQLFL